MEDNATTGVLVADVAEALSTEEESRLAACERKIQAGVGTFISVGNALLEIRNSRLYRRDYRTFEDYVAERWPEVGGVRRAYQLMAGAEVMENLSLPAGDNPAVDNSGDDVNNCAQTPAATPPLPTNEAQLRPLARLSPEQQLAAWKLANEICAGETPTANEVAAAAHSIAPKPEPLAESALPIDEPEAADDEAVEAEITDEAPASEPELPQASSTPAASTPAPTSSKPASGKPTPAAKPAPTRTPSAPPAPAASAATPKVPAGFLSTFVPRDDCLYIQDAGYSMAALFGIGRRLIDLGTPYGLGLDDLVATLDSTLNGDGHSDGDGADDGDSSEAVAAFEASVA